MEHRKHQTLKGINLSKLHKCNQVWEDMPQSEKGRICQKCQQNIIDFRQKKQHEIAEIHTFSHNRVCGLYTKDQLESYRIPKPNTGKTRGIVAGFLGLFAMVNADAQITSDSIKTIQTEPVHKKDTLQRIENDQIQEQQVQDSILIYGIMKSTSGEPIVFANVYIENTEIGTTSDFNGQYVLNVTEPLDSMGQITLIFFSIGYAKERKELTKEHLGVVDNRKIDIIFQEVEFPSFYVIEKQPLHKRIWNRFKRIIKK